MARTRSTNTRNGAYITNRYYYANGTFKNSMITGPNGFNGETKSITDESHPGFRNIMNQGGIVMGALDISKWNRVTNSSHLASFGTHPTWGKMTMQGDMTGKIYGYADSDRDTKVSLTNQEQHLQGKSLIDCYAAMNTSSLLVGEVARDLNATLRMITNPFQASTRLIDQMITHRRWLMKRRKSMTVLAATTSSWLEYRYGWKPLIMDAGAIVDLATKQSHRSVRRVFRGGGECSGSASKQYEFSAGTLPDTTGSGYTMTWKKRSRISSGIIAEFSCSGPADHWVAGLGLRPRDIVPTIWETIPYSFVADWFVNVGDWLQAITPAAGRRVLGSWTTTVRNDEDILSNSYAWRWVTGPPQVTYRSSLNDSVTHRTRVIRTINPSLPKTPLVKPLGLSPIHAIDGASLIVQRIVNGLRSWRH